MEPDPLTHHEALDRDRVYFQGLLQPDHPPAMNPLKVAIVGGGPSSFYVASRLLSLVPLASTQKLRVHIYDRLWSPYGLVRYGVAPDHPEVKVVGS